MAQTLARRTARPDPAVKNEIYWPETEPVEPGPPLRGDPRRDVSRRRWRSRCPNCIRIFYPLDPWPGAWRSADSEDTDPGDDTEGSVDQNDR